MLIRTWGFVATKPHSPWVSVEVRAERGALVRTSGLPPGAALESMARLRAALAHVGLCLKTQALTLHVHPTCTKEDVPHLDLAPGPKPMAACSSWTSFWNGPDPPASRCVMSWKPTAWNCTGQRALRFGCPNPGSWPPPTPAPADEATNNACARRRSRNCTAGNARRPCLSASPFNLTSDTIHGRAPSRGRMSSNGLVAPSPPRAFHGRAVPARVG